MKIEGPDKSRQAGPSKKKDKAGAADDSFSSLLAGEASGAKEASGTQSIARVDALLAVQAASDPTEGAARKRMHLRAENILNELEHLRMGLLTGNLSVGDVINIADVVASHREKITDAKLTAILDEIDLRAQVELAKIKQALS